MSGTCNDEEDEKIGGQEQDEQAENVCDVLKVLLAR